MSLADYQRKELVSKFLMLEIMLNRMLKEKKITKTQEKEIRLRLKPIRYNLHLSSPNFQDNEKLKKEIKVLCLNDFIRHVGFDKDLRFVDSQDST